MTTIAFILTTTIAILAIMQAFGIDPFKEPED